MNAFYVVRPAGAWLEKSTSSWLRRSRHTFKAGWSNTEALLKRELDHLEATDVVLQLDVRESDLRIDGMLRANARPGHPGVRISFESMHGPLTYATDSCEYWQHNVRSIALGLEALRAVDRYGVTHRGEQYTGWKAIGTGPATAMGGSSHMTRDQAAQLLERIAIGSEGPAREAEITRILANDIHAKRVLREARAVSHPDRNGGNQTLWDQVEQAAKVLGVLS